MKYSNSEIELLKKIAELQRGMADIYDRLGVLFDALDLSDEQIEARIKARNED